MSLPRHRRLLVVLHDENLNGASIAVLRLVEPLRALGWEVAFWAPGPGEAQAWLEEQGYDAAGAAKPIASGLAGLRQPPGLSNRLRATPGYLRAFARRIRSYSPHLVHANSLYSFAEASTARALQVPTVMHLHDMVPASWKAEPVRQMLRHVMSDCVAVSTACAESYATGGWLPRVVHGAAPVPSYTAKIRERPRPFVVGTVGVISRRKGSDLFVSVAEKLRGTHPDIEFRMIGKPSDPLDRAWGEEVVRRAEAAGIRYSPSAEVEREMGSWDAFVLPSRRDPFPLVTLEAMGLGLPVIGAQVDGVPEQLAEGAGILIPSERPDELARAIVELASSPAAVRQRLGSAARERSARLFEIERQAAEMDELYRELAT